jgi:peptidoglycan LD-endopeptidase LytH
MLRQRASARIAIMVAVLLCMAAWPAGADDLDALRSERESVQGNLEAITAELDAVTVRLTDAEATRARLAEDLEALQSAAEEAGRVLAARAVHAYVHAGDEPLDLVLGAGGPTEALDRARLLESIGRRELMQIEQAEAARAAYGQRRTQLAQLTAELRADEERLAVLRAELDEVFAAARAREMEVATRRDRQRTVSRTGQAGTYACPIAPPFTFRDTWGAPRSGGRSHKGVDIFGEMGADTYAITHGVILRHSNSRLGGLGLYLQGDDGNQYYYSHLLRILPEYTPGRRVEAGELIAANGDSGNARGGAPHIHMEVRPGGGGNVNPYPFAAAACF